MQRKVQTAEADVKIGRKFYPSEKGNMRLTRSSDRLIISLVNFDEFSKEGEFFKVCAWSPKTLQAIPVSDKLNQGMNTYFRRVQDMFHELIEV